jgi:hypothetical protein
MPDRLRALAFNELSAALAAEDRWVPLSGRQRIADRLVAVIKKDTSEAEAALEWGREALTGAIAAWTTERDIYRERADRKGYSHDEAAAQAYGAAIKSVAGILAALDVPERSADAEEAPDG